MRGLGGVQQADDDALAVAVGERADTEVDATPVLHAGGRAGAYGFGPADGDGGPAVLRGALLGDVEAAHDLDAADHGGGDGPGELAHGVQRAVEPVADQRAVAHRLDVHVAGGAEQGLEEHQVYQAHGGGLAGGREQVALGLADGGGEVGFDVARAFDGDSWTPATDAGRLRQRVLGGGRRGVRVGPGEDLVDRRRERLGVQEGGGHSPAQADADVVDRGGPGRWRNDELFDVVHAPGAEDQVAACELMIDTGEEVWGGGGRRR